ncbi:energy transducer TonB [Myxococcota bacterium]
MLVNPNAAPYRVTLPPRLARLAGQYTATLRICVSPEGHVASVSILRSSEPAVDARIPGVLRRWRYEPWLEDGRAVPFCYSLQYRIASP